MWEKENVLVNSIFSFTHNVFYFSYTKFHFGSAFNFLFAIHAFNLINSRINSNL